ncbi:MAG TPA: VOC family protein [Polyangia bacterium]
MPLSVHLTFAGECEAAFRFYEQLLGGAGLAMFRWGDSPAAADVAPEWRDKLVHASITVGGHALAGADVPGDGYERPRGFYLLYAVAARAEAERIFAALADGGEIVMPLAPTFWSPCFGVVVDRFGTPWEITASAA